MRIQPGWNFRKGQDRIFGKDREDKPPNTDETARTVADFAVKTRSSFQFGLTSAPR